MLNKDTNPPISGLLLGVTWLEAAILLWAGLGLLFYPTIIEPFWPWPLAPFNLRYLGALHSRAARRVSAGMVRLLGHRRAS